MALWTWWAGDPRPDLRAIDGFGATRNPIDIDLSAVTSLPPSEIQERLDAGHAITVARIDAEPVAYGWSATLGASIGELGLAFALPARDRYLWDFVTLPAWRGRGIYPRLLQAMLTAEAEAERFWIINAPENRASAAGIAKAGFQTVGNLSFLPDRGVGSAGAQANERAIKGAMLLGVPLLEAVERGAVVSPCWRCVIASRWSGQPASCWPDVAAANGCCCG